MVDNNFTIKMKRWLEAGNHTKREDIMEGAMMLLQLNRNQALFNTIARRPEKFVAKIEYEMKKFLPIRLAKMTMSDVNNLDAQVTPVIKEAIESEPEGNDSKDYETIDLPARNGKREDHDSLPEDIKALWYKNVERWKKIKTTYNTLLTLTEPCDRYEHLVILKDLWYDYKKAFETYDSYTAPVVDTVKDDDTQPVAAGELAKSITNARSYISKNVDKLVELREASAKDEKQDAKYRAMYDKVSERVQVLVENKQPIGDDLKKKLADGGLVIENNGEEDSNDTSTAE